MKILICAVAFLASCSAAEESTQTCEKASKNASRLAAENRKDIGSVATEAETKGEIDSLRESCESDKWPAEAVACIANAKNFQFLTMSCFALLREKKTTDSSGESMRVDLLTSMSASSGIPLQAVGSEKRIIRIVSKDCKEINLSAVAATLSDTGAGFTSIECHDGKQVVSSSKL